MTLLNQFCREGIMPQSSGKVSSLEIRQTPNLLIVLDASVTLAAVTHIIGTFTLWETPVNECVPSSISIARSLNVSLLREALIHKLDVVITHTDPIIVIDDQGNEILKSFVEVVRLL
jgi:hypothetical protein